MTKAKIQELGQCPTCGRTFKKWRSDHIYDTDACRVSAARRRGGASTKRGRPRKTISTNDQ